MNARSKKEPRQLPLMPLGGLGPLDDPVGAALGIADENPDDVWRRAMELLGSAVLSAYDQAQAEPETAPPN